MAWWERVPRAAQAWLMVGGVLCGLVGGAFALGAATGPTVDEVRGLPARVRVLESTDSVHTHTLSYLMRVDSQRIHVWDSVRVMTRDVAEIACILRADVEGTDKARCLSTFGGPRR